MKTVLFLTFGCIRFTQRTKIAFHCAVLAKWKLHTGSPRFDLDHQPGRQQKMSTPHPNKKGIHQSMMKCIAVETGKLTNYFILYLTIGPTNIILGFPKGLI